LPRRRMGRFGSLIGSSSEADDLELEELEDEGFEESLPFDVEAGLVLAEPELVEPGEVEEPEGEDDVVEGEAEVVDGEGPVEVGDAGGELLAVVEFVFPDDFDSSLSAVPSLRRCSTGRPLLLSSSSMTGGVYFLVLVCAIMPSGNHVPSAIQL